MSDESTHNPVAGSEGTPIRAPRYELILWNQRESSETVLADLDSVHDMIAKWNGFAWLDIEGAPMSVVEPQVDRLIGLHPIAADTLRDGPARAKVQDFGSHLLATMIFIHNSRDAEVIDFIVTEKVLVTVQERPGDCFARVREQLKDGSGRIRELGTHFLLMHLGRAIADSYRPLLAELERRVDRIEDSLSRRADRSTLHRIHHLRTQLMTYRSCVIPLRESIVRLLLQQSSLSKETQLSLRELEDELAALQDIVDFQRDRVQRLIDLYLNAISNRLNDVMRVLTIISTIFMPLSFVAGVYGMNFQDEDGALPWNMPE
ncbi:MAG: hypothetical protein DWI11_11380, partial [Planctomycetota bacterium]